jgi:hypothetical protein
VTIFSLQVAFHIEIYGVVTEELSVEKNDLAPFVPHNFLSADQFTVTDGCEALW